MCVVRGWHIEELHLEENLLQIKAKMDQPRLDASYYNPCDFILDPKIAEKLDKNVRILSTCTPVIVLLDWTVPSSCVACCHHQSSHLIPSTFPSSLEFYID